MTETPRRYQIRDAESSRLRHRPDPPNFEATLQTLPPDVRSVAESLALRDTESAKSYVQQYISANLTKMTRSP